jgi:hypothetical protein
MRMTKQRCMALLAIGTLVLGACGDDDEPTTAATTDAPATTAAEETTTTAAEETTTTAAEEVAVTELDITAADFSYAGAPTTLEAGLVRVSLTNEGAEEHQATIVRLHDGVALDDFAAAGSSDPTGVAALALVDAYAGPNSAPPGGTVASVQNLTPGDYVMLCLIPSPSDGVPHFAKGMIAPFAVTGEPVEAELDAADIAGAIGLDEFAFALPQEFSGTFAVTNDGEQVHEAAIYSIAEGSTIDDVVGFLSDPASATGPPPFEPVGGIAAMSPGETVYTELDLAPGSYAFLCFLPDTASDGAPHFIEGMAQQVDIG